MNGCEALSEKQLRVMLLNLKGLYSVRNHALIILGTRTGFRISELLSLTVGDVWIESQVPEKVHVRRSNMKGSREGRTVVLHEQARGEVESLIAYYQKCGKVEPGDPLFRSGRTTTKAINRSTAWRIVRKAARMSGIIGRIGTHSMRKTFASRMYDRLDGNIYKCQQALGHRSVQSTANYLSFRQEEIDAAILA